MSNPTFPLRTDPVIGTNDAVYTNTWDSANIEMWSWFIEEHDIEGRHTAAGPRCLFESGVYNGNGEARTITLVNTNIDIQYIEIYCSDTTYGGYVLVHSASMANDTTKRLTNTAFTDNEIISVGLGTFSIGTSNYVNFTDIVYYYSAWGVAGGLTGVDVVGSYVDSEINWMEHGDDIEVSATPAPATDPVTKPTYEVLTKVRVAHADNTGVHLASAFTGANIEVGTYTGDGNDDRDISLFDTTIVSKRLIIFSDTTDIPVVKTASMAGDTSKLTNNTALAANMIQSIGTGTFQVGTHASVNTNLQEYFYVVFGI